MKSIKDIAEELKNTTLEEFQNMKKELEEDSRKGVQKEVEKRERYFINREKLIKEYRNRQRYEIEVFNRGYKIIAGLDEVGRGPLAGPVCAAAVILDTKSSYMGIKDSKKLSEKQRIELDKKIRETAVSYAIGWASPEEIDEINILNATKLAMERAIEQLKSKPDYLLLDAINLNVNIPQTSIIKGDDRSISIGAASIIAKVARDNYMYEMSKKYPEYMFDKNKGYGTHDHTEAIKKFGPCEIHRRSFIKNFLGE